MYGGSGILSRAARLTHLLRVMLQPPASPATAPEGIPPKSTGQSGAPVAGAMFRDPTRGYQPQLGMPNQHAATVVVRQLSCHACDGRVGMLADSWRDADGPTLGRLPELPELPELPDRRLITT